MCKVHIARYRCFHKFPETLRCIAVVMAEKAANEKANEIPSSFPFWSRKQKSSTRPALIRVPSCSIITAEEIPPHGYHYPKDELCESCKKDEQRRFHEERERVAKDIQMGRMLAPQPLPPSRPSPYAGQPVQERTQLIAPHAEPQPTRPPLQPGGRSQNSSNTSLQRRNGVRIRNRSNTCMTQGRPAHGHQRYDSSEIVNVDYYRSGATSGQPFEDPAITAGRPFDSRQTQPQPRQASDNGDRLNHPLPPTPLIIRKIVPNTASRPPPVVRTDFSANSPRYPPKRDCPPANATARSRPGYPPRTTSLPQQEQHQQRPQPQVISTSAVPLQHPSPQLNRKFDEARMVNPHPPSTEHYRRAPITPRTAPLTRVRDSVLVRQSSQEAVICRASVAMTAVESDRYSSPTDEYFGDFSAFHASESPRSLRQPRARDNSPTHGRTPGSARTASGAESGAHSFDDVSSVAGSSQSSSPCREVLDSVPSLALRQPLARGAPRLTGYETPARAAARGMNNPPRMLIQNR